MWCLVCQKWRVKGRNDKNENKGYICIAHTYIVSYMLWILEIFTTHVVHSVCIRLKFQYGYINTWPKIQLQRKWLSNTYRVDNNLYNKKYFAKCLVGEKTVSEMFIAALTTIKIVQLFKELLLKHTFDTLLPVYLMAANFPFNIAKLNDTISIGISLSWH